MESRRVRLRPPEGPDRRRPGVVDPLPQPRDRTGAARDGRGRSRADGPTSRTVRPLRSRNQVAVPPSRDATREVSGHHRTGLSKTDTVLSRLLSRLRDEHSATVGGPRVRLAIIGGGVTGLAAGVATG